MNKVIDPKGIEEIKESKKIRDALTGTFILNEWEINILDLPIVQRLRRINQTALTSYTYPCADHNRFQHTLGVLNIISRFVDVVQHKYPRLINSKDVQELRIAALLHDVGHGPYSHASEEIYEHISELKNEISTNPKFSSAQNKPHEILSYYIIKSKSMSDLITRINEIYGLNLDNERIANIVIGQMDNPKREGYISDFLNGPFDSDKLDYMPRDAYFSGLKMEVDWERIAHTTFIDRRGGTNPRKLCCDISGAHNLEQILFNKILLYSSMYHHHKVRAGVCMLKSIFEIMYDFNLNIYDRDFKKVVDFLSIDDYFILSTLKQVPQVDFIIENIRNRQFLKRALVLSRKTVNTLETFQKVTKLSEDPSKIRKLRELITDEITQKGASTSLYEVWVDIPKPPSLREASQCKVKITDEDYPSLSEVFPADWWLTAYNETKWKGHIFCPPNKQLREIVNKAAIKILRDEGIEVLPSATTEAKII
jgi:HD superfamily phosphohydrolase